MKTENKSPISILIVDDEDIILKSLTRLLEKNYKVFSALTGAKALELLKNKGTEIGVIISDQRMPEMSGVDFLKESITIKPDVIRIILTGYTDLNDIVKAINEAKIYKFLMKPVDPSSFLLEVKRATELHDKEKQTNQSIQTLTLKNQTLENKIKQLTANGPDYFLSYEELKKSLTITPSQYFDSISESLHDMEDANEFTRRKSKLLRLAKDGKSFIKLSEELSTDKKMVKDFWKVDEIITETFTLLAEWKKRKYLKFISNIPTGINIYGNKTILRDIIFIHSIVFFAENFLLGDTIYFNSESFEENFYTIILSSSKNIDKEKIQELFIESESPGDSIYKNESLYFLHKLLAEMKGSINVSNTKNVKSTFLIITLRNKR